MVVLYSVLLVCLLRFKNYVQDLHGHCIHFVLTASSETLFFNIYFLLVHRVSEVVYMCPLFLKLSSILKLLILTAKLLVIIKTQNFYSCLILTENFVVSIKSF